MRFRDKSKSRLWITWETQRRNADLAEAFQAKYLVLDFSSFPSWIRYPVSICFTIRHGFFYSKKIIFAQCPSLVLALVFSLWRYVQNFTLIIDAHNAVLDYLQSKNVLIRFTIGYCLKRADFVIVSNSALASALGESASRILILPDRLPTIGKASCPKNLESQEHPIITCICSFAPDEPTEIFLQAMESLSLPFTLYVTGKKKNAGKLLRFASKKILFTDFLPSDEYDAIIQHSDLLVDLTTRDDCLVRGAYEAVTVGVPIVLSNTLALKDTFTKGCIFAVNTVEGYHTALRQFLSDEVTLQKEIFDFQQEYHHKWNSLFEQVAQEIILGAGIN